ncbi:YeaC family protein [Pectobacterium brasiliense]|uniref:YeaC family protein n=1 Tax=Pectobacterium brasiliense TaxID=180957 RepID=UPI00240767A6|nr:YeaC family protein [Pectobacterium brasiliense]MDG0806106.1 YeaC family protein [Pectobacterium brasiliense]
MELNDLIDAMTPEIYQRLVTAVELGKWPDGVALTAEQKENSLQMVMMWQARHNEQAEHMTIGTDGEIVMKSKQELKREFNIADTIITLKPDA